jgi:hypothetical protein
VAFGLELDAVVLPLVEAPCALLPAASDVLAPVVLPMLPVPAVPAVPVEEPPDWS